MPKAEAAPSAVPKAEAAPSAAPKADGIDLADLDPVLASSFTSLRITNFMTPLTTQAYMPIIPLLLTEDFDEPPVRIGQLFFTLAFGSFISFLMMPVLLNHFSTKSVLIADFFVRAVAGLIWVYACWAPTFHAPSDGGGGIDMLPGTFGTLNLLFASRFLFGLTLNSFAISSPWIGGKFTDQDKKPSAIAQTTAMVGLGIMLGPMFGILVASLASTSMGGYQAVGWFTVVLSLLQARITQTTFADESVLGTGSDDPDPKTLAQNAELKSAPYYPTARLLLCFLPVQNFLMAAAFLAGFESTLTLQVKQAYGWTLTESMMAWGPMALFGLLFGVYVTPTLIDRFNWAKCVAIGLLWSWGSVFGINWFNLTEPIPAWWFVIEGVFGMGSSVVTAVLGAITAQRLPTDDQIQLAAFMSTASQLGRAVGPIAATWIFETAEERTGWSKGAGSNFTRMYMLFLCACMLSSLEPRGHARGLDLAPLASPWARIAAAAHDRNPAFELSLSFSPSLSISLSRVDRGTIAVQVFLFCNFHRIFGSFGDLSPKQKREILGTRRQDRPPPKRKPSTRAPSGQAMV